MRFDVNRVLCGGDTRSYLDLADSENMATDTLSRLVYGAGVAASGASPALPGELPQGCRGLAVDRHLNIMHRRIWLTTGLHPPSVVSAVLGSIPCA